jgi:hypothetical protein
MRLSTVVLLGFFLLSLSLVSCAQGQIQPGQTPPPTPPAPPSGVEQPPRPELPPPTPPPPRRPGSEQPGWDDRPSGGPEGPGGPTPPGRGGLPEGSWRPGPPLEPLMRLIAERRPELAERLERLRREAPERFQDVLLDALTIRLRDALDEAEAQPRRPIDMPPRAPGRPEQPGEPPRIRGGEAEGRFAETRPAVRALDERQQRLEMRSHELAEQYRELRAGQQAGEPQQRIRDELATVVKEQFEVRSQLRTLELQRMERELQRLQETLERLQAEVERREHERESIIQRRIDQLLGEGASGW